MNWPVCDWEVDRACQMGDTVSVFVWGKGMSCLLVYSGGSYSCAGGYAVLDWFCGKCGLGVDWVGR